MFPRIVLHDARGTFVSLSHFCPTAASLLFEPWTELSIVTAPASLVDIGDLDGLDARGAWPPLLRPGVLMDLESYGEWERRALAVLTAGATVPRDALDALAEVTTRIGAWAPGSGALLDAVHAAFDALGTQAFDDVRDRAAAKRWLAARLFGTWTAYQRDGLAATIDYLRACLETFERECEAGGDVLDAIRQSDLRIVHGA